MRMVDLIEKKADGLALSTDEIRFMVDGFVDGSIPDYQMSAMLMAILQRDMDDRESSDLTLAMMHSGDVIDLSSIPGVKVDKHSTGGVADTTTLIIAPLVAACGGKVAKMSGRGLGHTGGTLDKLESIPGVCVEQPFARFIEIVNSIGLAVIGQTGNLVPADKKMYALRDVTATVRSVPLIAASVMSKKLASGSDAILLDVKAGSGAFCGTADEAERLADLMVRIGTRLNRDVQAVVTDMNQPLGAAIGNALEVREAVLALCGRLDKADPLYLVSMELGAKMLVMSRLADSEEAAEELLEGALRSGAGLAKLRAMVAALGGDGSYIDPVKIDELCAVKERIDVPAGRDGIVRRMNTERIGSAAQMLGAGRATKTDVIDHAVGIVMRVRLGDRVLRGTPLCTLYVNSEQNLAESIERIRTAVEISPWRN